MTEPASTEREDPRLQVDPVLTLSGGQMTFGQKLLRFDEHSNIRREAPLVSRRRRRE
jgi:hypothetical protein